jgi:undecaprenyl diphosphate synthase
VSAAAPSSAIDGGGEGAVPRHVAVIMDGNGRWAARRHMPRLAGHRAGVEAVRRTVQAAGDMGIEALTLYAFSSENWRRPPDEISDLMGLLRFYLKREIAALDRNGVRLRLIGDWRSFDPELVRDLEAAVARLASNDRLILTMALNYGSRNELVSVVRAIVADGLDPDAVDCAAIEARLDTAGLPPLDLVIRTSGEARLSNFLLWQAAYSELVFTDTLWPDFDAAALEQAVTEFGKRERRYGGR